VANTWSRIGSTQAGAPDKFGAAILKIAALEDLSRFFAAGLDVPGIIQDVTELRRKDAAEYEPLSCSTKRVPYVY
jgi:hypothetical protein